MKDMADAANSTGRGERALRDNLMQRQHLIHHFVQARHTDPITLHDVAKLLHLSESRASHAVRQACGKSFVELLIRSRLRTAAGLLCHTEMSVMEVATTSGFRNASHFHQTFRKHFGMTPQRYRSESDGHPLHLPGQDAGR